MFSFILVIELQKGNFTELVRWKAESKGKVCFAQRRVRRVGKTIPFEAKPRDVSSRESLDLFGKRFPKGSGKNISLPISGFRAKAI